MPAHEQFDFDTLYGMYVPAPAVLWRGIGSLSSAIVNQYRTEPTAANWLGRPCMAWEANWEDEEERTASRLVVREPLSRADSFFSTLFVLGAEIEGGRLHSYTRYVFLPDQDTTEDRGIAAVFSGALDPTAKDGEGLQARQMAEQMKLGAALANVQDVEHLFLRLAHGTLALAGAVGPDATA